MEKTRVRGGRPFVQQIARRRWVTFEKLGLMGQLGNQLFQIAVTIGTAKRMGVDAIFPRWSYDEVFARPLPRRQPWHVPRDDVSVTVQPHQTSFRYAPLDGTAPIVLQDFYQSERFFENAATEVRRQLRFAPSVLARVRERHPGLLASRPWALHVRRGDYVGDPQFADLAATDYYERALGQVPAGTPVMLFSDDIPGAIARFQGRGMAPVVGQTNIDDMALMSLAAGNIIANSTFSWWGAWSASGQARR